MANLSRLVFMEEVGWLGEVEGQVASVIWSLATFCQGPPDKKLCSGQMKLLPTSTLHPFLHVIVFGHVIHSAQDCIFKEHPSPSRWYSEGSQMRIIESSGDWDNQKMLLLPKAFKFRLFKKTPDYSHQTHPQAESSWLITHSVCDIPSSTHLDFAFPWRFWSIACLIKFMLIPLIWMQTLLLSPLDKKKK